MSEEKLCLAVLLFSSLAYVNHREVCDTYVNATLSHVVDYLDGGGADIHTKMHFT